MSRTEGHYTIKIVDKLPKRLNANFLYTLRGENFSRFFERNAVTGKTEIAVTSSNTSSAITSGTGVNVTGSGTTSDPYVISVTSSSNDASAISVNPNGNITSNNVQLALEELQADIDNKREYPATDETKLAGIEENATADQSASEVPVLDTGNNYAANNVEDVLSEIAVNMTGIAHTSITGIDLKPTGNSNEYTIEISWLDGDGVPQTTTDPTPLTIAPTVVNNTLTSTSLTEALSANQGKQLKDQLDAVNINKVNNSDKAVQGDIDSGTANKWVDAKELKEELDLKQDISEFVTTIRDAASSEDTKYVSEKAIRTALDALPTNFLANTDTFNSFTGLSLQILRVNAAENAVEAITLAATIVSFDNTTASIAGNPSTTQEAIEALKALIDAQPLQTSVATYGDLPDPTTVSDGAIVHVVDASGDPTITSGWAKYQEIGDTWFKYLSQEDLSVTALTDAQILDDTDTVTGTVSGKQVNDTVKNYLIDEDDLISDDDTKAPTQQSVKAYADTKETKVDSTSFQTAGSENSIGINTTDDTAQKIFAKINAYVANVPKVLKSVELIDAAGLSAAQVKLPSVTENDLLFEWDTDGTLSYVAVPLDIFIDSGAYISHSFKGAVGTADESVVVFTQLDGTAEELDLSRFKNIELTQTQAEDDTDTTFGLVSGERLKQAIDKHTSDIKNWTFEDFTADKTTDGVNRVNHRFLGTAPTTLTIDTVNHLEGDPLRVINTGTADLTIALNGTNNKFVDGENQVNDLILKVGETVDLARNAGEFFSVTGKYPSGQAFKTIQINQNEVLQNSNYARVGLPVTDLFLDAPTDDFYSIIDTGRAAQDVTLTLNGGAPLIVFNNADTGVNTVTLEQDKLYVVSDFESNAWHVTELGGNTNEITLNAVYATAQDNTVTNVNANADLWFNFAPFEANGITYSGNIYSPDDANGSNTYNISAGVGLWNTSGNEAWAYLIIDVYNASGTKIKELVRQRSRTIEVDGSRHKSGVGLNAHATVKLNADEGFAIRTQHSQNMQVMSRNVSIHKVFGDSQYVDKANLVEIEDLDTTLINVDGTNGATYTFSTGETWAEIKQNYERLIFTGNASRSGTAQIRPYSFILDLSSQPLAFGQSGYRIDLTNDYSVTIWIDTPNDASTGFTYRQSGGDAPTSGRMQFTVVGQKSKKTVSLSNQLEVDLTGAADGDNARFADNGNGGLKLVKGDLSNPTALGSIDFTEQNSTQPNNLDNLYLKGSFVSQGGNDYTYNPLVASLRYQDKMDYFTGDRIYEPDPNTGEWKWYEATTDHIASGDFDGTDFSEIANVTNGVKSHNGLLIPSATPTQSLNIDLSSDEVHHIFNVTVQGLTVNPVLNLSTDTTWTDSAETKRVDIRIDNSDIPLTINLDSNSFIDNNGTATPDSITIPVSSKGTVLTFIVKKGVKATVNIDGQQQGTWALGIWERRGMILEISGRSTVTTGGTITFPYSFNGVPIITATPMKQGDNLAVTIQARTSNDFTYWVVKNEDDLGQAAEVHFTARGIAAG